MVRYDRESNEQMGKLAIVATIKTVPGEREEYLKHLRLAPNVV
jgi:hypothetical protein